MFRHKNLPVLRNSKKGELYTLIQVKYPRICTTKTIDRQVKEIEQVAVGSDGSLH